MRTALLITAGRTAPAIVAFALLSCLLYLRANAGPLEHLPPEMRFIGVANTVSGVNPEDARLGIEMIMQKSLYKEDGDHKVSIDYAPDVESAVRMLAGNRHHCITMTGMDYLKIRESVHLRPMLVATKVDQPTESYLLLARQGETLETIKRMPRRRLVVEQGGSGEMALMWLDVVLRSRDLPESAAFFTEVRRVEMPGRAVLPVFFGQADACVVAQSALDVLSELNPQIGRRLQTLKRSPGLVRVLICATDLLQVHDIDEIVTQAVNLDTEPERRQVLTIIQMKHLFRFESEYMNETEKVFQQYRRLMH